MVDGRCGSEDQSMYSRALLMQGKGKFNSVIAEQSQSKLRKYILARTAADKSQPYNFQLCNILTDVEQVLLSDLSFIPLLSVDAGTFELFSLHGICPWSLVLGISLRHLGQRLKPMSSQAIKQSSSTRVKSSSTRRIDATTKQRNNEVFILLNGEKRERKTEPRRLVGLLPYLPLETEKLDGCRPN